MSAVIVIFPLTSSPLKLLKQFLKLPQSNPLMPEVAFTFLQPAGAELLEGISYAKPLK